jgi:hypothetical protein
MSLAVSAPPSASFDIMLLVHCGATVVTIVSMAAAYVAAVAIGKTATGAIWPVAVTRYFVPGPDLAARAIYLIPITGGGLVGLGRGNFDAGDSFVVIGAVIWLVAVVAAETLVVAPSRELRALVSGSALAADDGRPWALAARLRWGVDLVVVLLVSATVVMVAQP